MSSIEYEWDEEAQQWIEKEELRLRKLKREIISELLSKIQEEFELEITMETGEKGKAKYKKK
jgi:hypothetical protein